MSSRPPRIMASPRMIANSIAGTVRSGRRPPACTAGAGGGLQFYWLRSTMRPVGSEIDHGGGQQAWRLHHLVR